MNWDYTLPQVEAWAAGEGGSADTGQLVSAAVHLVAEAGGRIVGYGNVEDTTHGPPVRPVGLPDRASPQPCDALEAHCRELGCTPSLSTPPRLPAPSGRAMR